MNILKSIDDPKLFAPWFKHGDWSAWRAFLSALFGLELDPQQLEVFQHHTGRTEPPADAFSEAWLICGRRSGKSLHMALCGVFLACFRKYRQHLQPGERATIAIIAADRKQARVILRYVQGMVAGVSMIQRMVQRQTANGFDFNNATTIEVGTASSRGTRGYTFAAVLCDEVAFWPTGDFAADPDTEILNAIRPGMATIPGAVLLCASSPYARAGELWEAFDHHHAKDDSPILVWQADTRSMNPSVPEKIIATAYERDAAAAGAEYGANFRTDVEQFINRELVAACTDEDTFEREPGKYRYTAFADPSGGSSDSFTLAIAHREGGKVVLDMLRETRPPFNPETVVQNYAADLKRYGISRVSGDRYAGVWPSAQFRKEGIVYEASEMTRSELYLTLLPGLNSKQVVLLDNERLLIQLVGLERRTSRLGKDSVDHKRGAHDDLANAAAGALAGLLAGKTSGYTLENL